MGLYSQKVFEELFRTSFAKEKKANEVKQAEQHGQTTNSSMAKNFGDKTAIFYSDNSLIYAGGDICGAPPAI